MAEQSISITVPAVTGNAPQVTTKVTDVVVQDTVTNVAYTSKTTDVTFDGVSVQSTGVGEEAVPNPNLFTRGQDYIQITESFSKYNLKPQFDTVTQSDLFSRLVNYNRPFAETQYAGDSYFISSVGKTLQDIPQLSEQLVVDYSKVIYDVATSVDVSSLYFDKILFDQIVQADEVTKLTYQKVQPDQVISTDEFSRIADYKRSFSDWVDATDDFLGEANIDDDQIALIGKNLVDYGTTSDVASSYVSITKADVTGLLDEKYIGLSKPFADSFGKTDQLSYEVTKAFLDTSYSTDVASKLTGKVLEETLAPTEFLVFSAAKNSADTADVADEPRLTASKPFTDSFTKSDTATLVWDARRSFSEQQATSDFVRFDATSLKLDTAVTVEAVAKYSTKLLSTQFTQADEFSRTVDYLRSFSDLVDATDDFFGAANIDDDQIASIGKNIVDYATTSELTRFDGTKLLVDATALQNPVSLTLTKPLADSFTQSDVVTLMPGKSVVELVSTQDTDNKQISKVTNDSTLLSNPISLETAKLFSDSTGYTTDVFSRVVDYNKSLSDLVDVTDDFLGEANVDDDQIASFGKNVVEYLALGDAPRFDVSVTQQDSYLASDIAAINTQKILSTSFGYSDLTSFLTNKNPVDVAVLTELATKSAGKSLSDLASSSDTASKAIDKQALDVFASTETSYRNAGKVASETLYTADVLTFLKYINPIFYETANAVDSGFINNQSYFAGTYVEPGYVGTNTYFT